MFEKFNEFMKNILNEQLKDNNFSFVSEEFYKIQNTENLTNAEATKKFIKIISSYLLMDNQQEFNISDYENYLLFSLNNEKRKNFTDYTFLIFLSGYKKKLYRKISVPSLITLAELGYIILATFNTFSYHLFKFEYNNYDYICACEDIMENRYLSQNHTKVYYAHDVLLADFIFNNL